MTDALVASGSVRAAYVFSAAGRRARRRSTRAPARRRRGRPELALAAGQQDVENGCAEELVPGSFEFTSCEDAPGAERDKCATLAPGRTVRAYLGARDSEESFTVSRGEEEVVFRVTYDARAPAEGEGVAGCAASPGARGPDAGLALASAALALAGLRRASAALASKRRVL